MKTIIFLAILYCMACVADNSMEPDVIESVWHDGCEYVIVNTAYGKGITHKGNCRNTQHD